MEARMSEAEIRRIEQLIGSLSEQMIAGQDAIKDSLNTYNAHNAKEHDTFEKKFDQTQQDINGLYLREENRDSRITNKLDEISKEIGRIANVELMVTQVKENHATLQTEIRHIHKEIDSHEADLNKTAINLRENMNSMAASIEKAWKSDLVDYTSSTNDRLKHHEDRLLDLERVAGRVGEFDSYKARLHETEERVDSLEKAADFLSGGWRTILVIAGAAAFLISQVVIIWSVL